MAWPPASRVDRSQPGWDEHRPRCRGSWPETAAATAIGPRPPTPPRSGGPNGPTCEAGDRAAVAGGVEAKRALRWSPQQIAGWLPLAYPFRSGDAGVARTSTCRCSCRAAGRCAVSCSAACARGGRCATREPSACPGPRSAPRRRADQRAPGRGRGSGGAWPLGRRPAGGQAPSAVATLVERASRYLTLVAARRVQAEQVRPALAAAVARLPGQLRRSLTWDQGKEMAEHLQSTINLGVQVYVCDPRSPGSVAVTRTPTACSANTCQEQRPPPTRPGRTGDDRRRAEWSPSTTPWLQDTSQALAEALP